MNFFAVQTDDNVSEPASVCGIIPARRDADQLHPLVDRCSAAAADLHIRGMLHAVAGKTVYLAEFLNSGGYFAVGYRKPFALRIPDAQDPVALIGILTRDRDHSQIIIGRKTDHSQIVSVADVLDLSGIHSVIGFPGEHAVIGPGKNGLRLHFVIRVTL